MFIADDFGRRVTLVRNHTFSLRTFFSTFHIGTFAECGINRHVYINTCCGATWKLKMVAAALFYARRITVDGTPKFSLLGIKSYVHTNIYLHIHIFICIFIYIYWYLYICIYM